MQTEFRSRLTAAVPFALVFLAMLPTTLIVPFQREVVEHLETDTRWKAFFLSITMLGLCIASPVAGILHDRAKRPGVMLSLAAFLNALSFLWILYASDLRTLLTARLFEGITFAFVIGPLVTAAGGGRDRGMRTAAAGLLLALGAALGLPLGGLLKSPGTALPLGAGIMVLVSILSLFVKMDAHAKPARPGQIKKLLLGAPFFLLPAAFAFLDRFIAGFLIGPFAWRLRNDLLLGPAEAGRLLGLVMLPMVLLAVPAAILSRRVSPVYLVAFGSTLYGGCIAAASMSTSVPGITVLLLLAGLGAGLLYAPSMILTSMLAPRELKTTAMSLYIGIGSLGFMLGPVVPAEALRLSANPADLTGIIAWCIAAATAAASLSALGFRKQLTQNASE